LGTSERPTYTILICKPPLFEASLMGRYIDRGIYMRRILALSALLLPMHLACGDDSSSSNGGAFSCDRSPLTAADCPEGWVFTEISEEGVNGTRITTTCTSTEGWRHFRAFYSDGGLAEELNDQAQANFSCRGEAGSRTVFEKDWTPCRSLPDSSDCSDWCDANPDNESQYCPAE